MLDSLKVKNFRLLADFEIPKLGAVNLIVGKNNSGKSSVLEALRVYASRGNPRTLQEIASGHGEMSPLIEDDSSDDRYVPFQDFFTGRQFPVDGNQNGIYIGNSSESDFVKINHTFYIDEFENILLPDGEESSRKRRRVVSKEEVEADALTAEQALLVTLTDVSHPGWIPLEEALSPLSARRSSLTFFWERMAKDLPVSYVPTQFLSVDYLAHLWDSILFSPYADEVKSALKILDENFEDLGFVKTNTDEFRSPRFYRNAKMNTVNSDRTAVVKLKYSAKKIPLSSMGDGMLRVLQLALTIFPGKGGFLLIDEFENGLHWSVQEKIWKLIFDLATDLDIQVFATTHSEDAVKAFSKVANERPEEGVLVKLVSKNLPSGSGKTIGVVYDEETLKTATMTETEIR